MVAIGRALMSNPRLLLCDEISLGLAPIVVRDIYARLPSIVAEAFPSIIVEQDIVQALNAATACLSVCRKAASRSPAVAPRCRARSDLGRLFRSVSDGMDQHHHPGRADRRALRDVRGRAVADLRRHAARQHRAWRPDRACGLSRAGDDRGAWAQSAAAHRHRRAADGGDRLRAAARRAQPHARRRPAAAAPGHLRSLHHHPERAAGAVHRRQPTGSTPAPSRSQAFRLVEGVWIGVLPLIQFVVAVAVIGGLQVLFYRTRARPRLPRDLRTIRRSRS